MSPTQTRSSTCGSSRTSKRLEDQLSEDHAGPEFERALEDLLDRLDREITE